MTRWSVNSKIHSSDVKYRGGGRCVQFNTFWKARPVGDLFILHNQGLDYSCWVCVNTHSSAQTTTLLMGFLNGVEGKLKLTLTFFTGLPILWPLSCFRSLVFLAGALLIPLLELLQAARLGSCADGPESRLDLAKWAVWSYVKIHVG